MTEIIFRPDGFFTRQWDSKTKSTVVQPLAENRFFYHAFDDLVLEEGPTLHNLMSALSKLTAAEQRTLADIAHCPLEDYMREVLGKPQTGAQWEYIEIQPVVSFEGKFQTGSPQMVYYYDLLGWLNENGELVPRALDASPTNEWAHVPLRLTTNIPVSALDYDQKQIVRDPIVQHAQVAPTFLEFIRWILWEISFYGFPDTRDSTWERIFDSSSEN